MFHVSTKLPFTEGDVQQVPRLNSVFIIVILNACVDFSCQMGHLSPEISILNCFYSKALNSDLIPCWKNG